MNPTAAKNELIAARESIREHSLKWALLHMKWAMEHILPEGQQYCSQTLDDDDPEKTLQGLLDNIVNVLRFVPKDPILPVAKPEYDEQGKKVLSGGERRP